MKKFNFKWLLLSIILSIASINQVWAEHWIRHPWSGNNSGWDNKQMTYVSGTGSTEVFSYADNWGDNGVRHGSGCCDYNDSEPSTWINKDALSGVKNTWTNSTIVKFTWNASTSTMSVTEADVFPTGAILYLKTSSEWRSGGGWFAAYFLNGSSSDTWKEMTRVGETDYYYVAAPEGYASVIFTRMKSGTTISDGWSAKDKQTIDLCYISNKNTIEITGWDGIPDYWSSYIPISTASLTPSTSDSVAIGTNVTLTPALTSNTEFNNLVSTSYSVTTNPNSGGSVTSAGVFSATQSGTYVVTATLTYSAKGFSDISTTVTATAAIKVYATITLDQQSGTGGLTSVNAVYGSALPNIASLPTNGTKKFEGYYANAGGSGTRYYHYNGDGNGTSDILTNTRIYANWKTPTEYTLYYAVSAGSVKKGKVQYNINFGYDQGWLREDMSLTDYTYNGKVIYSAKVTANYQSFDDIYFWPKGESATQEHARYGYISGSDLNNKMFVQGAALDTWIAHATDDPLTIYFVNSNSWPTPAVYAWSMSGDDTPALLCENVAYFGDSEHLRQTDSTYNGNDIYAFTFPRAYDKIIFSDGGSGSKKTGDLSFYTNYSSGYTLYNGSAWQAFGRDITIYTVPATLYSDAEKYPTTFSEDDHDMKVWYHYGSEEGHWASNDMTKTSYSYKGSTIYETSILAKWNVMKQIQFQYYDGETKKGQYDTSDAEEVSATSIDGKIYVGYIGSTHTWDDYGTDITLDRDGGTTGSISVTATVGSAMPSATMAGGNLGYSFAGYFTETNGGGTKYYNADGSSAKNWVKDGPQTLYANWTPNTLTFNGNAAEGDKTVWNNTGNWSEPILPTLEHPVIITKPVVVNIEHAKAKSIVLDKNSKIGKLTIQPNMGLEVAETITKTTDGVNSLPTGEEDLILESSSAGNASLIFNNSNSCKATVQLYAKGTIVKDTWNWQYVGTPFTGSIPLYNYYGSWMYKWNSGWEGVNGGDELIPFAGYCLTQESATTHVMGGTLVATNSNPSDVILEDGESIVIANSWTAPMHIGSFVTSSGDAQTFSFTPATIYLFNTGSAVGSSSAAGGDKFAAGTYVAVPIQSSPYTGDSLIAPMQGFFVKNESGASGTLKLKYADLVRPSASRTSIVAGPMHAPKNENHPNVLKIWAEGSVYNDRVVILEREDFSTGFDNGWDGEKLNFGTNSPSVYVINEQNKYDAVSAIPEFEGTKVGFRAGTDTECTIRFEYNGEEDLYLNDLRDRKSVQISDENTYKFATSADDDESRFVISKIPMQPTGIEDTNYELDARKQLINGTLYILRDGKTYNAEGALVK